MEEKTYREMSCENGFHQGGLCSFLFMALFFSFRRVHLLTGRPGFIWQSFLFPWSLYMRYLLKNNPEVLERRMRMREKEASTEKDRQVFFHFFPAWLILCRVLIYAGVGRMCLLPL